MGCDCHFWVEVRDRKTKQWFVYKKADNPRNYMWFSIIAGVRGNDKFDWHDRGLPGDISHVVTNEYKGWKMDAHSMTWLSYKEVAECMKIYMEREIEGLLDDDFKKTRNALNLIEGKSKIEQYNALIKKKKTKNVFESLDIPLHIPEQDTFDFFAFIVGDAIENGNKSLFYLDRDESIWYDDIRFVGFFDN